MRLIRGARDISAADGDSVIRGEYLAEKIKIVSVVGTRPEAIKMAPVILALEEQPWAEGRIIVTAQHRELLDNAFATFGIEADVDLDLMRPNQSLSEITGRAFINLEPVLKKEAPDFVLAQGDTTTVMVTAMVCFYLGIPFGHVEAGLRTGDLQNPFPEEVNRVIASKFARLHFAPTKRSADALRAEQLAEETIVLTGNTVIDALISTTAKSPSLDIDLPKNARLILMTAHRRENFGTPLESAFSAVVDVLERFQDVHVLYPVHPNPNVKSLAHQYFGKNDRVFLREPMTYEPFVAAMSAADIVLTDSGGVQEEAPAIGKPVLVMREETERPEATESGGVKLVGTDADVIRSELTKLLTDPSAYSAMSKGVSPYGDGIASQRVVGAIASLFGHTSTFGDIEEFSFG